MTKIINVSKRALPILIDGERVILPPSGSFITYTFDITSEQQNGIELVNKKPKPTANGVATIRGLKQRYGDDVILLGDSVMAEAYPGEVLAPLPAPADSRVQGEELYSSVSFRFYTTEGK